MNSIKGAALKPIDTRTERLLGLLRLNPHYTQRELASQLDLRVAQVSYTMRQLRAAGAVPEHRGRERSLEATDRVWALLTDNPGLSNLDLALHANIPQSSLDTILRVLVARGFVTARLSRHDGRRILVPYAVTSQKGDA